MTFSESDARHEQFLFSQLLNNINFIKSKKQEQIRRREEGRVLVLQQQRFQPHQLRNVAEKRNR
jgi:hypothetical protein